MQIMTRCKFETDTTFINEYYIKIPLRRFYWRGPEVREVEIRWLIDASVTPGTYRIRHFGYYKLIQGGILNNYEGKSGEFLIT